MIFHRVTFSYSRTAGFDPLIRPDVPEHLNDLYGTRCPLCRNSFPVLNASVYDAKHKAKFVSGFDPEYTVYPTTNTITRKLKAMRTAKSINESMSGGACSNEEGFRPWRLDNGTTLGY
jgi:hypothetical protein